MAVTRVRGEQLDLIDITSDIAADPTSIGNIATGVVSDAGAKATLDGIYQVKVVPGTVGDFAALNASGELIDGGVQASDLATAAQGSLADSALQDVIDDTTPQLGGHLDLNNFDILGAPAPNATSPGGAVDITAGAGGATSGIGGAITITGGAASSATDYGGDVIIASGASSAHYAGSVRINSAQGPSGSGYIYLTAADGTATGYSGEVQIQTGNSGGYNQGGDFVVNSGNGFGIRSGGRVQLFTGDGGASGGKGGDIQLEAGNGIAGDGYGGGVRITAGNGGTINGAGGDIVVTPGSAAGSGQQGAIAIAQTTAPAVTINRLYNAGGTLTWNGIPLTAPPTLSDADGDTVITVEESADEDVIVVDTGDGVAGYPAQLNTLLFSSGQFTLALPAANVAATNGGGISLTSGAGYTTGAGGPLTLTSGNSGAGASGDGGVINITAGDAVGTIGTGGIINITGGVSKETGGSTATGGDVNITGGALTGTGSSNAGDVFVTGGESSNTTTGQPGNATLRGGTQSGGGTSAGGSAAIVGGSATGSGSGGGANIFAGNGGPTGAGGIIQINGGAGGSISGAGGDVWLKGGSHTSGGVGSVALRAADSGAGETTELHFNELGNTNYVGFKAADVLAGDVMWTLPVTDSTGTQALVSNGSGTLSWLSVATSAQGALADSALQPADIGVTVASASIPHYKSYSATALDTGEIFIGGFYSYSATDATLTIGGTVTQTFGTAGQSHAAHAFVVASGAGGTDLVLTVSGVSIDDAGNRNGSDSEIIVADTDTATTDQYFETSKKWLGQVTFTLTGAAGSFTFNYGLVKYEDFGNRDFTITDFEVTGRAEANETGLDIELLHHEDTAFTYSAGAFSPNTTPLVSLGGDHSTDNDVATGDNFAYKRAGLSQAIAGSASEGTIIRVTTAVNNSMSFMNFHLGVTF
jgi:hypothetical protein